VYSLPDNQIYIAFLALYGVIPIKIKRAFLTLIVLMLLPGLAMAQVGDVTARFEVSKIWIDGDGVETNLTTPVDVNITCTTGLPLSQDATITSLESTTFVLGDLLSLDDVDCLITETVPSGYGAQYSMNAGAEISGGCVFKGAGENGAGAGDNGGNTLPGVNDCRIFNTPLPVNVTVYTEWLVVNEGGDEVDDVTDIWIRCNSPIVGISVSNDGYWIKQCSNLVGDNSCTAAVIPNPLGSSCTTWNDVTDSSVEHGGNCGSMAISPGNGNSCTFIFSVFFEGIPTLSQYGLAIMALLMLGVGFVGFRRFV